MGWVREANVKCIWGTIVNISISFWEKKINLFQTWSINLQATGTVLQFFQETLETHILFTNKSPAAPVGKKLPQTRTSQLMFQFLYIYFPPQSPECRTSQAPCMFDRWSTASWWAGLHQRTRTSWCAVTPSATASEVPTLRPSKWTTNSATTPLRTSVQTIVLSSSALVPVYYLVAVRFGFDSSCFVVTEI